MSNQALNIAKLTHGEKIELMNSYISFLDKAESRYCGFLDMLVMVREMNENLCTREDEDGFISTITSLNAISYRVFGELSRYYSYENN